MVRVVKEAAAAPRQRVREGPALAVAEGSHGQWLKGCTARWLPSSVTRPFPLLCSASPDSPRASGSPPTAARWLQRGPAVPVPRQEAGAGAECSPRGLSDSHGLFGSSKAPAGKCMPAPGITHPRLCPRDKGGKRNEALKAQ